VIRAFTFALSCVLFSMVLGAAAVSAETTPARLQSVRILPAGRSSSLALQTSTRVPVIATTAPDPHTLVIELVGTAADRDQRAFADQTGIISRIAIDNVGAQDGRAVTQIRVSLLRPFRHHVRAAGNLVYVDFERRDETAASLLPSRRPPAREPALPVATKRSPTPLVETPAAAIVPLPSGDLRADSAPDRAMPAVDLVSRLSRVPAFTEWLQHEPNPVSGAHVGGRAWIPLVLKEGSVIYSYGEYAEINGRIMFPLPFDDSEAPAVQAVSLRSSAIDPEATQMAAESVRAARYALTHGEADFALLGQEVTAMLNGVPMAEPAFRVALLEMARRRLIEWPPAHHGYRARDVSEVVGVLDEVLGQFRATAGADRFDLSLVAPAEPARAGVTFRQPTLVDLLGNAMKLVGVLDVVAERTAVLRATAEAFDRHQGELPPVWLAAGNRFVSGMLRSETRLDTTYRELTGNTIKSGLHAASLGEVDALLRLRSELIARDKRLGGQRPDVISATMEALDAQFAIAAQTRVQRDQWLLRIETFRAYAYLVEPALRRFAAVRSELQRIQQHSNDGGSSKILKLWETANSLSRVLEGGRPPEPLTEAHGLLVTAARLAAVAAEGWVNAKGSRRTGTMTDASAAAAGALMTFDRGRRALQASLRPPEEKAKGKR